MPTSVWGYEEGDMVEVRLDPDDKWLIATVVRFNLRREPVVIPFGTHMHFVVGSPTDIRPFKQPSTPDDIESFLAQ